MTDFEMLELALDGAIHKLQAACNSASKSDFRGGIPYSLTHALETYKEVNDALYWANFDRAEKAALENGDLEGAEEIRRAKERRKKEEQEYKEATDGEPSDDDLLRDVMRRKYKENAT